MLYQANTTTLTLATMLGSL